MRQNTNDVLYPAKGDVGVCKKMILASAKGNVRECAESYAEEYVG